MILSAASPAECKKAACTSIFKVQAAFYGANQFSLITCVWYEQEA